MGSFVEAFGAAPAVRAEAPGRVNLLGEHTDYNDGYVLPTTISQRTRVELGYSTDARYRFYSEDLGEHVEYSSPDTVTGGFGRYVCGCIEVLRGRGVRIEPMLVYIQSDVPIGSGLSSSAALEVAMLRGMRELFGLQIDDVEIARLAQKAEVEYAGVRCGILDQMACSLARESQMLFLDTRTLARRLVPLPPNSELVVIDSGVARTLAASGYNTRRAECEAAARLLGVAALRDVSDPKAVTGLPAPLDRRARHVITENARVLRAAEQIDAGAFGQLMNASHRSLQEDYEVSVPPLDELVRLLQQHEEVFGARLTGAGFGGACVSLVRKGTAENVKQDVLRAYANAGYRGVALV
jgi:galactokinase